MEAQNFHKWYKMKINSSPEGDESFLFSLHPELCRIFLWYFVILQGSLTLIPWMGTLLLKPPAAGWQQISVDFPAKSFCQMWPEDMQSGLCQGFVHSDWNWPPSGPLCFAVTGMNLQENSQCLPKFFGFFPKSIFGNKISFFEKERERVYLVTFPPQCMQRPASAP